MPRQPRLNGTDNFGRSEDYIHRYLGSLQLFASQKTAGSRAGIDGSAYFIGGFGMTALAANNIVVVPIRAGVGLRLGANVGYL